MSTYREAYKKKLEQDKNERMELLPNNSLFDKIAIELGMGTASPDNKNNKFIYEIEDGILYDRNFSRARYHEEKALLTNLTVMQSFFVPINKTNATEYKKEINKIRGKFLSLAKILKIKLGSTVLDDKKGFGIRFWRLS